MNKAEKLHAQLLDAQKHVDILSNEVTKTVGSCKFKVTDEHVSFKGDMLLSHESALEVAYWIIDMVAPQVTVVPPVEPDLTIESWKDNDVPF